MSGLGSALRELAATAQPPAPAEPALLWDTGRRRVLRRRFAGAAVALGLVAAVGTAALMVPTPTVVMPAGQPHAPAIPENIYIPPTHLAGTAQEGPLGQLAVLSGAQRGSDFGLFGISARTGEYRFLDLPDLASGTTTALSPDGNHVAYWFGPAPGNRASDFNQRRAGGVAVYDTRTGAVEKVRFTRDGVLRSGDLLWTGDSSLLLTYRANRQALGRTWQLGSQPRPASVTSLGSGSGLNRDGSVLLGTTAVTFARYRVGSDGTLHSASPGLALPDPATPQSPKGETEYGAVSTSGDLVLASPFVGGPLDHPVMVGVIPTQRSPQGSDRVSKLTPIGQLQEIWFLGWVDDHTALVTAMAPDGTGLTPDLYSVDLRARTLRRLGVAEPQSWGPHPTVATDLLAQPMVRGLHPPQPRHLTGFVLAGVVLVGGPLWLVWLVRRRRRA